MYNPANFSVNYAASSNYSNSAGYANGAGYADSLKVNGSVVDPNSLGVLVATYTGETYEDRTTYAIFSCPGFTKTNGRMVILSHNLWRQPIAPSTGNGTFIDHVKINDIKLELSGGSGYYDAKISFNVLYYVNGNNLVMVAADFAYDCRSDCRCGDDGF